MVNTLRLLEDVGQPIIIRDHYFGAVRQGVETHVSAKIIRETQGVMVITHRRVTS